MLRRIQFGSFGVAVIALSFVVSAPPAVGQGLRNVIHSGTRVFPGVGPGVGFEVGPGVGTGVGFEVADGCSVIDGRLAI